MTFLSNHILVSVLFGYIMQFESENPGHITIGTLGGYQLRVDLEEHMVETASEIGAVDRCMTSRFGVVNVFTAATE